MDKLQFKHFNLKKVNVLLLICTTFHFLFFISPVNDEKLSSRSIASQLVCDTVLRKRGQAPRKIKSTKKMEHDTSIELELDMSKELLNILTTKDGKLGSILNEIKPPFWLKMKEYKVIGKSKSPMDIEWSSLNYIEQKSLLNYISKKMEYTTGNATLEGLKVKDTFDIYMRRPTIFLNKEYPVGWHTINVSKIFGRVEIHDHKFAKKTGISMLELHFRSNLSSGEVAASAWTFLDFVNIERPHLHAHIVVPYKIKDYTPDSSFKSVVIAEFYRRINLGAELTSIFDFGFDIVEKTKKVGVTELVYFGFLKPRMLRQVAKYFRNLAEGIEEHVGTRFKMAAVAMKGLGFYDQSDLFGFEYRDIGSDFPIEKLVKVLDRIQEMALTNNFGITEKVIEEWLNKDEAEWDDGRAEDGEFSETYINNKLDQLLYTKSWEDTFKNISDKISNEFTQDGESTLKSHQLQKYGEKMQQLKMILNDWSKDPLYLNDPAAVAKVEEAQISAIRKFDIVVEKIEMDEDSIKEEIALIVIDFIRESSLINRVLGTLNYD